MIQNSKDIALIVKNIDQTVRFFRDVLDFKVTLLKEGTYKVHTKDYNLYITSHHQDVRFSVLMEFLTDDIDSLKQKCLENNCEIIKWSNGDKWLKHESGFSFHLDNS